ncbi:MAG: DDE-type integrase/transposase/recombinase, partial [Spirochaetota bacterium]|nr:DDE-type integrase/transposase/recombinase [Spirochaetota bacterium]
MEDIEKTRHRTGWPYYQILSLYEISKSEINRWRKEKERPKATSRINNPNKILDEEIEIVISYRELNDENRNMGYRKFTWKMVDEGIVYLSESSVYRILFRNKLLGKFFKEHDGAGDEYENKPEYVHHHWHTDIAYVIISRINYYLVFMLDGYSRYILNWQLMTDMTGKSVELFTQNTLDRYKGASPKIIHDNGSQYISLDFKRILFENECIDVPTRRKHPETNGKAERLIGLIRQESLRPNSPSYYGEAQKEIRDFVWYYNNKRYHAGINYLRPAVGEHPRQVAQGAVRGIRGPARPSCLGLRRCEVPHGLLLGR